MAGLWYRLGTVTLTNGSKRVTGVGTTWNNTATGPIPGNTFWGPDSKPYEVERVISDLELDIVETYAGATVSGAAYKIDTTRKGTVPALASQVTATLSYAQGQYANMSTWAAGDMPVNVDVVLPDGVSKKSVPNLVSMTQATAAASTAAAAASEQVIQHAEKTGAHPISGVSGLQTALDSRLLTSNITGQVTNGAVLESWSNASGYYRKFADGTFEQIFKAVIPPCVKGADAGVSMSFPGGAFIAKPRIVWSTSDAETGAGNIVSLGQVARTGFRTTTSTAEGFRLSGYSYNEAIDFAVGIMVIAIGRWK